MSGTSTKYNQADNQPVESTSQNLIEETAWTIQQKKDAAALLSRVVNELCTPLGRLYKAIHTKCGISAKDFLDCLRDEPIKSGKKVDPILTKNTKNSQITEEDVYEHLDYQTYLKYLLYGHQRSIMRNGQIIKCQGSSAIIRECVTDKKAINNGRPSNSFLALLRKCITIRNESHAHQTDAFLEELDMKTFEDTYDSIRQLSDTLFTREYERLTASFWPPFDEERERIYRSPIPVEDFGLEVFSSSEDHLTEEQLSLLDEHFKKLNMEVIDGIIYKVSNRSYQVRLFQYLLHLTTENPETEEQKIKIESYIPESIVGEPVYGALPPAAKILSDENPSKIRLQSHVLDVMLEGFVPLLDETIFTSYEGRIMLEHSLLPALSRRKKKITVDESVIHALFTQFRESAPYTQLELNTMDMDEDEKENAQEERRKTHKNLKDALKAIDLLRRKNCLTVASSLTNSRGSYWNIYWIVEKFPQKRFVVLTMDRALADKMKEAHGQNAAAMKVNIDGSSLMVYRSTRDIYNRMLTKTGQESINPEKPAGSKKPAEAPKSMTAASPLPLSRDRLKRVMAPHGDEKVFLSLGGCLGEGGEGATYEVQEMPNSVAKIYHPEKRTAERQQKLAYMIEHNPNIPRLCWPEELIYSTDGNQFLGFLMPRARGKELGMTIFHPGDKCRNITKEGWTRKSLAIIAANISDTVQDLHRKKILMGDVNSRNILVGPDCSVWLLDCDSYQIGSWNCPVGTILYTPPELHLIMKEQGRENYNIQRTFYNERYSLAVLLFQILMLGQSPYATASGTNRDVIDNIINKEFPYNFSKKSDGEQKTNKRSRPPAGNGKRIWSNIPYDAKEAFYDVFAGDKRRTPREWADIMQNYARLIQEGKSTDELQPTTYKELKMVDGKEVESPFVNLVCDYCHEKFNLDEGQHRIRQKYNEPTLCSVHWDVYNNLPKECEITCTKCLAKTTESAKWYFKKFHLTDEKYLCADCRKKQQKAPKRR